MTDWIGSVGWRTEVDTSGAEGGIARTAAEIEAGLAAIDRMEATAQVNLNTADFDRDAARIRAEIARLERERLTIKAKLEETDSKGWTSRYKAQLEGVNRQLAEHRVQLKEVGAARGVLVAQSKKVAAQFKAERDRIHGTTQSYAKHRVEIAKLRETYARLQKQMKMVEAGDDLNKQFQLDRLRAQLDLTEAKLIEYGSTAEDINVQVADDTEESVERQKRDLVKLRLEYARAATAVEKYGRQQRSLARARFRAPDAVQTASGERAIADAARLRAEIDALGGSTVDLDTHIRTSAGTLSRWSSALAGATVRVGPFTMTIKTFGIAVAALGPAIFSVIGSLSALIGTIGKGLIGGVAGGAAAITAFGLTFMAVKSAVAPYVQQLGFAIDATTAYQDAVAQFGKNSEEAKTALENMNQVLDAQPPQVQRIAKAYGALQGTWTRLTKGAKGPFFDMVENGIAAAEDILPTFAKNAVNAMEAIEQGSRPLIAALKGPIAGALDGLMDSFIAQIPTAMRGLGSLGTGLARVFDSAGRVMFGPAAGGFAEWAQGFADSTKDAGALDAKMEDLRQNAAKLLDLGGSAGGLMGAFFGAGSDTGMSIMDDMIGAMDEWKAAIEADDGAGLKAWFDEQANTAQKLWHVIEGIGKVILGLSEALEGPFNAFLDILGVVTDIATTLSSLPGLGTLFDFGVGALMASKLPIVGPMLTGMFTRATAGASKYGRTLASTVPIYGQFGKAATTANAAVTKSGTTAAAAGGRLARLGAGAASVGSMFVRGASMVGRFLGPVGMAASVALLAADALGLFGGGGDEAQAQLEEMLPQLNQLTNGLKNNSDGSLQARQMMLQYAAALQKGGAAGQMAANQIRQSFEAQRAEIKQSVNSARDVFDQLMETEGWQEAWGDILGGDNLGKFVSQLNEAGLTMEDFENNMRETGKVGGQFKDMLLAAGATKSDIQALNQSLGEVRQNIKAASEAKLRLQFDAVNLQRLRQGLEALGPAAQKVFGRLQQAVGKNMAAKIAVQVDDRQALQRITGLSTRLTQMGRKEAVVRILASDASARQKLAALERLKDKVGKPVQLQVKDAATSVARKVAGAIKQVPDRKTSNLQARDNASGPARAAKGAIDAIPAQKVSTVTADTAQAIAQAQAAVAAINAMTAVIKVTASISGAAAGAAAQGGALTAAHPSLPGYASGGGYVTKPIFMVGEEAPQHPEFVIATNPRYRQDNVRYLFQAAAALRIPGFAKGKGAKGKGYTPPTPIRVGAIPEETVQAAYDRAKTAFDNAKQKVDSLEDKKKSWKQAQRQYQKDKADTGKDEEPPAPPSGGFSQPMLDSALAALEKAKRELAKRKEDLQAVKRANQAIENLGAQIALDTTKMANAQQSGNQGAYNMWKIERLKDIDALLGKLRKAERHAEPGSTFRYELADRIAQLEGEKAEVRDETSSGGETLTANEQQRLEDIESRQALARLTADGGEDDLAAGRELVSFWEGILARLQSSGGTSAQITEAASALYDAREAVGDIAPAGGGGVVSQADQFNTARSELYRAFGGNVLMGASAAPFTNPGASSASPGTTVNQEINFLETPSDSHSWANRAAWEAQAALG